MRKINSTIILLAPVVKISFLRVSIIKVLQFLLVAYYTTQQRCWRKRESFWPLGR